MRRRRRLKTSSLNAVVELLREVWPRLWEALLAVFSYRKGYADAEQAAAAAKEVEDSEALRRVLRAPRADRMQRDEVVSELERRGLRRVPGEPADRD